MASELFKGVGNPQNLSQYNQTDMDKLKLHADFLLTRPVVGDKTPAQLTFKQIMSRHELSLKAEEGPTHKIPGYPNERGWLLSPYSHMNYMNDPTGSYSGVRNDFQIDYEECAIYGVYYDPSYDSTTASGKCAFILFFDMDDDGKLIAEGLQVAIGNGNLRFYEHFKFKESERYVW